MKVPKWLIIVIYIVLLFFLIGYILILKNRTSENIDINWVRNYYNIISSITSTIVGITGIVLGLFYYFDKERRNKNSILKKCIEEYDHCVKRILKMNFKDDKELKDLRIQIESINDNINLMMDNKIHFLQLSDNQISKILKVNSYVNKSEVIMKLDKSGLENCDRASVLDVYENKFQEALIICYSELK